MGWDINRDTFLRQDVGPTRNNFLLDRLLFLGHSLITIPENKSMERTQIHTPHAPAAIGPYSQAIRCGQFIYTSGQIPLDPTSGTLIGEDVQAQTHQVLQNLSAVLTSAGSSLKNVVKTTVFLKSMSDFQAMNEVYATYFQGVAPARSTIAVAELPRKALVEIECVALVEG
jgi:2-iminobutanoate/2-iminopropanoate deaminase